LDGDFYGTGDEVVPVEVGLAVVVGVGGADEGEVVVGVDAAGELRGGGGVGAGDDGAGGGQVETGHCGRQGEVELDLVVLEGNQGQGEAGGLVEEEDQGHVETLDGTSGLVVNEVSHATVVLTVVVHAEQGVVHAEPVGVVLIDALATNLQLNILQQLLGGVESGANLGQHKLHHDVSDQVTVTGDLCAHLIAEPHRAIDRLLDGLNGEVGVPTVYSFEESNLGISGKVNVLCAICN